MASFGGNASSLVGVKMWKFEGSNILSKHQIVVLVCHSMTSCVQGACTGSGESISSRSISGLAANVGVSGCVWSGRAGFATEMSTSMCRYRVVHRCCTIKGRYRRKCSAAEYDEGEGAAIAIRVNG